MSYYIISERTNGGAIVDMLPRGSPQEFRFRLGISLASEFPMGGTLKFSSLFPQHIRVCDFVTALLPVLVISSRVKHILEESGADNCEFLPILLEDHKGQVASSEHFILNVLGGQEAIDVERSKYKMNALVEHQIERVNQLVLAPERIDPKALLFRASRMMGRFFLHQRLLETFQAHDITGLKVYPADGWNGKDL